MVLVGSFVVTPFVQAAEVESRDAQLADALKVIRNHAYKSPMSLTTDAVGNSVSSLFWTMVGVGGLAVGQYLKHNNSAAIAQKLEIPVQHVQKARDMFARYGRNAGIGVAGLAASAYVMAGIFEYAHAYHGHQVRQQAIKIPSVYRTEMTHFLELTPEEQFLIVRADNDLTDAMINLADNIRSKR